MKIGIVGEETLSAAWELRLQKQPSITEVVLTNEVEFLGNSISAVILLDPTDNCYEDAAIAVREGYHVFLVSKLPVRREQVERLYHYSEESGVGVQLAHWASFNPASQWLQKNMKEPATIHIERSLTYSEYKKYDGPFRNLWIEDVAIALKLVPYNVHRIDVGFGGVDPSVAPQLQLFLRFDNGTTASIFVQTTSQKNRHIRTLTGHHLTAEHNVTENNLMIGRKTPLDDVYFERIPQSGEEPADRALSLFLDSVQKKQIPSYSVYDGLKLVRVIETIEEKLFRFM